MSKKLGNPHAIAFFTHRYKVGNCFDILFKNLQGLVRYLVPKL